MSDGIIDRSLDQGGFWKHVTYTVPDSIPKERIDFTAPQYRNKGGETLEAEGFKIHKVEGPNRCDRPILGLTGGCKKWAPHEPDRHRYHIGYWVSRRPQEHLMDVPDAAVAALEDTGMRLAE